MVCINTFLREFKKIHNKEELLNYFKVVKDLNVLVIGETVIDVYQYGTTLGKSNKSPIIAFENKNKETYDGGVLAIKSHLKDFVGKVDYYTWDTMIIKKRYIQDGQNQKLFETYTTKKNPHKNRFNDIADYDIVLVADFGHGFLTKERRNLIQEKSKFIALNTQANAGNMGLNTINKYSKWDYISIDEHELRLATSNQFDDVSKMIIDRFNKGIVTITRGPYGCIVFNNGIIKSIPIISEGVVDTIGAGDALFAISSLFAYQNAAPEIIGFMGNIAGNIACNYPGNKYHVTKEKVMDYIKNIYE